MWLSVGGISLEIIGFLLMIMSTRKLVLHQGEFNSDIYVEKSTGKPPKHIEGAPNPLIYRPGIGLVIAGLALQIGDLLAQYFGYQL